MSTEQNEALVNRYMEEVWNKGNLDALDELFAENYVAGLPMPGTSPDLEGFRQFIAMARAAFPDLRQTVEDSFAAGDRVVQRWTFGGTHKAEFMGVPPTGKDVAFDGISIYRIEGGRILQDWTIPDLASLMTQLGVIPAPG